MRVVRSAAPSTTSAMDRMGTTPLVSIQSVHQSPSLFNVPPMPDRHVGRPRRGISLI